MGYTRLTYRIRMEKKMTYLIGAKLVETIHNIVISH